MIETKWDFIRNTEEFTKVLSYMDRTILELRRQYLNPEQQEELSEIIFDREELLLYGVSIQLDDLAG